MQLQRAALVLVVLAALGAFVPSSATIIKDVVGNLTDFAQGKRLVSGLSKDDLIAMLDEWKAIPENLKAEALNVPHYKLLYHFGIVPTERIRDQLDDIVIFVAHVHRFEKAYKRFLPAYLGSLIENGTLGILKSNKMHSIYAKLARHQACTLKDFELLNMEHSAWVARYEDIVTHEDVYTTQDEMRNILNYHNGELVKPLFDYVLPSMGQVNDPAVLQQLYYDKLFEVSKIRFNENGKPIRFV